MAAVVVLLSLSSCRDGDVVIYSQPEDTGSKADGNGSIKGMYVLCEGNMGSNHATLDYLDLSGDANGSADGSAAGSGNIIYHRNIYSERNPNEVKELGDVGNDVKVYGSKLWMVINCSNKVEVADVYTCRKQAQIDIPNCRYLAFAGGYAYVSAYVAPVAIRPDAEVGAVYKVDTLSLKVVDKVTVGYQPEELAVVGGKLYVANSGGYRAPNYDRTVSVIDLATFREERKIDVAQNLHRLRADKYGQVWVSSRGDYQQQPASLCWLQPSENAAGKSSENISEKSSENFSEKTSEKNSGKSSANAIGNAELVKGGELPVAVSDMCIVGDSLYYLGVEYSQLTGKNTISAGIINVREHRVVSQQLSASPEMAGVELPYGIIVNPEHKDFYVMDAKNYVSSGELLHFRADGSFDWRVWTGDIPGHAAFVYRKPQMGDSPSSPGAGDEPKPAYSKYILAVDEYRPAPGQFVNVLPKYEEGDDAAAMARKCTEEIAGDKGGLVSLGGYGGYITFHFDHSVKNVEGERDLLVKGNTFNASEYQGKLGGSCEPGIVMVSQDVNGNGLPDDPWYELSGSADVDSVGKVVYGYEITYRKASAKQDGDGLQDVPWTDNQGASGYVYRNSFHSQEYFPLWLESPLRFSGTLLPRNGFNVGTAESPYWFQFAFRYGYVDNLGNNDREGCSFDIGWAVDSHRKPVHLDHVDFVRVYSAENQTCGWLGETSTEVTGAEDLHIQ